MQVYKARRPKSRRFFLRRRAPPLPERRAVFKSRSLTPLSKQPRPRRMWLSLARALRALGNLVRLRRVPGTVLFGLGLLWLAGGMAWGLWRAWELPLGALEITGTRQLTPVQVAAAAGLYPGVPVGGLDPLALAQRLLEQPRIARADVRRMIPGRLEIRIAERQAAALALLGNGRTALVDREGIVLERDPEPETLPEPALPRVQGGPGAGVEAGRVGDETVRRGLALAEGARAMAPLAGEALAVDARDPFVHRIALPAQGRTLILSAQGAETALRAYLDAEPTLAAAVPGYRTADLRAAARVGVSWIALSR